MPLTATLLFASGGKRSELVRFASSACATACAAADAVLLQQLVFIAETDNCRTHGGSPAPLLDMCATAGTSSVACSSMVSIVVGFSLVSSMQRALTFLPDTAPPLRLVAYTSFWLSKMVDF